MDARLSRIGGRHCWVGEKRNGTARWKGAVCAAGWVGQEVGDGCTAE